MRCVLGLTILLSLVGVLNAAYATNTNALYTALHTCSAEASASAACVANVKNALKDMSSYIQKLRDLKTNMGKINNAFNILSDINKLAKYIPTVGTAINVLVNTLNAARVPLQTAHRHVTTVDSKVYPYKAKADSGARKAESAENGLIKVKDKCITGRDGVNTARACVNAMSSGSLKTTVGNSLESLGGALSGNMNEMANTVGSIDNACSAVKSVTDITVNWPDIDFIIRGINDVYDALKPILDFFDRIRSALNQRFCMPNPIEATAEVAKEVGREVNERGREIAERTREATKWIPPIRLPRVRLGWGKRKRSMLEGSAAVKRASFTVSEAEANSMLYDKRAADVCFSVQTLLDGVDALFKPIVDLANKAIDAVLSALPSFTLPGFPDYSNLFRINFNFNLPDIDFGFDVAFFTKYYWLDWSCATQVNSVCRALSGSVSFNCGRPLSSHVAG